MAEARRQMELSATEQQVVERMRLTPEQRQAEVEARRQERPWRTARPGSRP